MNFEIIFTHFFTKELKRLSKKYPSLKEDLTYLLNKLQENPKYGEPIGKDCYKIRLALTDKNKGKSGGARIITFLYTSKSALLLLGIYDKSEKETVEDYEIKLRINKLLE